jgi:hypothetical protein
VLCLVTFCVKITYKAIVTLPEYGILLPKHVGATLYN